MHRVFPQVVPFARTAIRLHPRKGSPTADQSSVGGPLLWPADEPWPTCDGDDFDDHLDGGLLDPPTVPLVPVMQLFASDISDLPFPDGTDVLQVLWCPFDRDPWSAPRPELRWRRRDSIGGYPGWTQSPDWPTCQCETRMDHLLTNRELGVQPRRREAVDPDRGPIRDGRMVVRWRL